MVSSVSTIFKMTRSARGVSFMLGSSLSYFISMKNKFSVNTLLSRVLTLLS